MKSSLKKIIKHKFDLYTPVIVGVFVVFFKAIFYFFYFFFKLLVSKKREQDKHIKIIRYCISPDDLCVF